VKTGGQLMIPAGDTAEYFASFTSGEST